MIKQTNYFFLFGKSLILLFKFAEQSHRDQPNKELDSFRYYYLTVQVLVESCRLYKIKVLSLKQLKRHEKLSIFTYLFYHLELISHKKTTQTNALRKNFPLNHSNQLNKIIIKKNLKRKEKGTFQSAHKATPPTDKYQPSCERHPTEAKPGSKAILG